MKDKFLRNATREYSSRQRGALLVLAGMVFLILLPAGLIFISAHLDQFLSLPKIFFGWPNLLLSYLCIGGGLGLGLWSNYVLFTSGRGTPVPLMATQELQVQPPYSYCRNPMALGAILGYLGVAVLLGSLAAFGMVLLFATVLLLSIHRWEEEELQLRFGEAYREYRNRTPFIFPHFRR